MKTQTIPLVERINGLLYQGLSEPDTAVGRANRARTVCSRLDKQRPELNKLVNQATKTEQRKAIAHYETAGVITVNKYLKQQPYLVNDDTLYNAVLYLKRIDDHDPESLGFRNKAYSEASQETEKQLNEGNVSDFWAFPRDNGVYSEAVNIWSILKTDYFYKRPNVNALDYLNIVLLAKKEFSYEYRKNAIENLKLKALWKPLKSLRILIENSIALTRDTYLDILISVFASNYFEAREKHIKELKKENNK